MSGKRERDLQEQVYTLGDELLDLVEDNNNLRAMVERADKTNAELCRRHNALGYELTKLDVERRQLRSMLRESVQVLDRLVDSLNIANSSRFKDAVFCAQVVLRKLELYK